MIGLMKLQTSQYGVQINFTTRMQGVLPDKRFW